MKWTVKYQLESITGRKTWWEKEVEADNRMGAKRVVMLEYHNAKFNPLLHDTMKASPVRETK